MKNRIHKLILALLIGVMCANCALPELAAAEMTGSQRKYFEDSVAASKKTFLQIYGKLRREQMLDAKLAEAVDRGVDEKMNSLLWGTRGLRMMLSEENQKEALEMVIKEIAPCYEAFVKALQDRFKEQNYREIGFFYENLVDGAVAKSDDPIVKDKIRKAGKFNQNVLKLLAKSLAKKHIGTNIKPDTIEIDISSQDFNFQRNTSDDEKSGAGKMVAAAATGTATGVAVAIAADVAIAGVGVFVAPIASALGSVFALSKIVNAPDKLKAEIKSALFESLAQMPAYCWDVMEGDVRAIFEETYAVFQLNMKSVDEEIRRAVKEANEIANSSETKVSSKDMANEAPVAQEQPTQISEEDVDEEIRRVVEEANEIANSSETKVSLKGVATEAPVAQEQSAQISEEDVDEEIRLFIEENNKIANASETKVSLKDMANEVPVAHEQPAQISEESKEYKKGKALIDANKYDEACVFFKAGAEKGDPWCMNELGMYYMGGWGGLEKNEVTAFDLFSKASAQNIPEAILNLGFCYLYGTGVPKNTEKGIDLVTKAAELDDLNANYILGDFYETGNFVKQDYQLASDYYKKAKQLGSQESDIDDRINELEQRLAK